MIENTPENYQEHKQIYFSFIFIDGFNVYEATSKDVDHCNEKATTIF